MFMAGIDPTVVRTSAEGPQFRVGTIGFNMTSSGPKGYIYVRDSGSAITGADYLCLFDGSTSLAVLSTLTTSAPGTGAGKLAGIAQAAIAASGYGWLQIFGATQLRALANCAMFTLINTTATAGTLDDDATAGSEVIDGLVLTATNGGSTASVAAFLNWPKVGRTL